MSTKQKIYLGGGCFWCLEAVFLNVRGVSSVVPGYAGGNKPQPTYKEVCEGTTGHAEVVEVIYNFDLVSLADLLTVFFGTHDPTTLNRQENDIGSQYRSIILYSSNAEREVIKSYIAKLEKRAIYDNPIITEVIKLDVFYEAEKYHHNYFAKHPDKAYCQAVINPKLQKFRARFVSLLKNGQ